MEIVQILKALGDQTRIRIVNILREGPLCVCEIESILEITQSNASRHLNKLMNAKIVIYYKEAKFVYYKIDENTISKHGFIKNILDNELEKEDDLKYDYKTLKIYKNAGLSCDNVLQIKEIISKANKEKEV